jgi:protein SCO1/2
MRTLPIRLLVAALAAALCLLVPNAASAHDEEMHDHQHMHHAKQQAERSTAEYAIPQVQLVRDDGKSVWLADELNDGRPVVLNFIFTTCTEICPLVSHTLSELQDDLGPDRDRVHFVSISIDPEQDTPARLHAYAKKYAAGPEWQHYSGTLQASITAQRAFDAYRGNKMNHLPVTFLRASPGQPWVRLDGFATSGQLLQELRVMLAAK